jgi:WD40 repeat protein
MGIVYRALQEFPERIVALKVMRPTVWERRATARFQREVQILARLQHPSIAQLFVAGSLQGPGGASPFLAMELIDGVPVTTFARGKALLERIQLAIQVCDAVAYAHSEGIIHRDLKPANILVDTAGRVKIVDFGLGSGLGASVDLPTLTEAGQFLGTPDYMSPEQASGADLDERTDVYSLGVSIYELVAGRRPIDVSTRTAFEASRMIQEEEAPRLRSVCSWIPADIEIIVSKAMAKERPRRYAKASALADDLRRFVDHRPITARRSTALYRASRLLRRHRYIALSTTFVVLSMGVGLTAALHEALRAEIQAKLARTRLAEAEVAQGDILLKDRDFRGARRAYMAARGDFVAGGEDPLPASLGLWDLDLTSAYPARLLQLRGAPRSLILSPNGSSLAIIESDGTLKVEDALSGAVRWNMSAVAGIESIAFAPDSHKIALLAKSGLTIADSLTGEAIRNDVVKLSSGIAAGPGWFCAILKEGGLVIVSDDPNSHPTFLLDDLPSLGMRFDSLGNIWTSSVDGFLYRASYPNWKFEKAGILPRSESDSLVFGPAANFAARNGPKGLEFWTINPAKLIKTQEGPALNLLFQEGNANGVFRYDRPTSTVEFVSVSGERMPLIPANGATSISTGEDLAIVQEGLPTVTVWENRQSRVLRRVPLRARPTAAADLSGDGNVIAVPMDGQLRVQSVDSGLSSRLDAGARITCVSLDRDGQAVALCTSQDELQFWNIKTLSREAVGQPVRARRVAFSPDGESAVSCDDTNSEITYWRKESGRWVSRLLGVRDAHAVAFNESGSAFTIGRGKIVEIWRNGPHPGRQCQIEVGKLTAHPAVFANNDKEVITLDTRGSLVRWSAKTGEKTGEVELPATRITDATAGGRFLYAVDLANDLCVYDVQGKLVRQVDLKISGSLRAAGERVLVNSQPNGEIYRVDFSTVK